MYDKDIDGIVVEGEEGYREARDFMRMIMPSQSKKIQVYREATPLFSSQDRAAGPDLFAGGRRCAQAATW